MIPLLAALSAFSFVVYVLSGQESALASWIVSLLLLLVLV